MLRFYKQTKPILFCIVLIGIFLAPQAHAATTSTKLIEPTLSVDIPGLSFSKALFEKGDIKINYIGEYISGVYTWIVGAAALFAIVMIMIGGLQYSLGATSSESVGKGKKRIKDAVVGLVLLLSTYAILAIVNPNLVIFKGLTLESVEARILEKATSGAEGAAFGSVSRSTCDAIVSNAIQGGKCNSRQKVTSPTGAEASCGQHHWFDRGANGDFKKITNLDYKAPWGGEILAPFDGNVTYTKSTSKQKCGNKIVISGTGEASGAQISICHVKDFIGSDNQYENKRSVEQGEVIGHIGGNCCAEESAPDDWATAKNGWCNKQGTSCSDPETSEDCSCQTIEQSGNTSGPHVHITWNPAGGDLLACIDY
jgi:hypothetical protein